MAAAGDIMYSVRPHYSVAGVETSDVMYGMKRLVSQTGGSGMLQGGCPVMSLCHRQEALLAQLDSLIATATSLQDNKASSSGGTKACGDALGQILKANCPADLVIKANPDKPPRWLSIVNQFLEKSQIPTWWKFHTHSTVPAKSQVSEMFPESVPHQNRYVYKLVITVIWMDGAQCPSLHTSPSTRTPICGETNIVRFFARLLGVYDTPSSANEDVTMDLCLDTCDIIESPSSTNQERASALKSINTAIERSSWFRADALSLCGAFLASVLLNYGLKNIPQDSLKKWVTKQQAQMKF